MRTKRRTVFDVISVILFVMISLIMLIPIYKVLVDSFDLKTAYGMRLLPQQFGLDGYISVFTNPTLFQPFLISCVTTIAGTFAGLAISTLGAYVLIQWKMPGRKLLANFLLFTMIFNGGMIPTYLVIQRLQMLNTIWALILPGCLSVYNMIVARTFFKSNISEELYEAAEIDGCTQARFFFQIALPLSKAIIAILVLYYGVGHWNSYFSALVYISDKAKYPLQLVLRNILITNQTALSQTATTAAARAALQEKQQLIDVMKYSLIIISSIPVLVMYPLVQKHFVKGVMIGSMKG